MKGIKVRKWLVFGIIFVLFFVIFVGIPENSWIMDADAETWTQTSDVDFNSGSFSNVELIGTGDNAKLQLKTKNELYIWDEQHLKPLAGYGHAMVYDSANNKIVLFGGYDTDGRDDETWVYDLATDKWIQKSPTSKPSARYYHGTVYDSVNHKVVLFGGYDAGGYDDETWVYDVATDTWTQKNPISKPLARYSHTMVYDSTNNKVVLFGGYDAGGYDDETWVYNVTSDTWTQKSPISKPSSRYCHSMAYDSANNKVVLFGGYDASGYDDETWIYDVTTHIWTQKNPISKPSARAYHAIAYDSTNNKVVLFGGYDSGGYNDETWKYDMTSNNWTQKNPTLKPSARQAHAMAYDSANNKVVLFGGEDTGGYDDETWVYDLTSDTWTQMNPSTKPSARNGHTMAYDSANKKVVLFGGYYGAGDDETWLYDVTSNTWTQKNPTTKPSARWWSAMAYDSINNKVVLFGGHDGANDDETWVYDVATNTWIQKNPVTKPSARHAHAMAYDTTNNKVVLFGGHDGANDDETWVYDVATNTWTQKNPATKPSARHGHGMDYDSINNKIILFGGGAKKSNRFSDTWVYDVANDTWTQKNPTSKPSARWLNAMVYDSASNKIILFGGCTVDTNRFSDTWIYDVATDTWTQKNPPKPSARYGHGMVYDSANNKVVLFGGYDGAGDDETWVYELAIDAWKQKDPPTKPSARHGHGMAYDSANNKIVLFGGYDAGGKDDETWIYDVATRTWTKKNPIIKPSPRHGCAMVYDSANNKIVLFGGHDSAHDDETWVYDVASNTWTQKNPAIKPVGRHWHAMVYDSTNNKIVLFGGYYSGGYAGDTWVYDVATDTWTFKNLATKPVARGAPAMAYDSANNKIVLFGGIYSEGLLAGDTWIYDVISETWTNTNPTTRPPARRHHTMTYNSVNNKIVLFGGYISGGSVGDTWIYDVASNTWTQKNPTTNPSARYAIPMTYDSANNKVVLFGGLPHNDETWVFYIDDYYNTGTYTSKTYTANVYKWHRLTWAAETNTTCFVRFQVAVNNDGKTWNYVGPDGTSLTYYDELTGGDLYPGYNGEYLRYKAYFTSTSTGSIPKLLEVSITYLTKGPTVQLTSPNGAENWMKESFYPITWNSEGDLNSTPICLYYSTDNGKTWTTIIKWMANSGHYNWTVPNIETSNALIKVIVTDLYENTVSDTSDASFAIDPPPPITSSSPNTEYQPEKENRDLPTTDNNPQPTSRETEDSNSDLKSDSRDNDSGEDYNLIFAMIIIIVISLILNTILIITHKKREKKIEPKIGKTIMKRVIGESNIITASRKFIVNKTHGNIHSQRMNRFNSKIPLSLDLKKK